MRQLRILTSDEPVDALAERRRRGNREADQLSVRIMIEDMVRRGCSEREIAAAVRARAAAWTPLEPRP